MQPVPRKPPISLHALPVTVAEAKQVTPPLVALVSSGAIEGGGALPVLSNPIALVQAHPEVGLGLRITRLAREAQPLHGSRGVLRKRLIAS